VYAIAWSLEAVFDLAQVINALEHVFGGRAHANRRACVVFLQACCVVAAVNRPTLSCSRQHASTGTSHVHARSNVRERKPLRAVQSTAVLDDAQLHTARK